MRLVKVKNTKCGVFSDIKSAFPVRLQPCFLADMATNFVEVSQTPCAPERGATILNVSLMDLNSSALNPFIVVSKFNAFLEVAVKCGLAPEGTRFLQDYSGEDLRGHHVVTDHISLADAAYAVAVTIIPLDLPEELNTVVAPAGLLLRYAGPGKTYWVQGSSTVVTDLYNGGPTPLALTMARAFQSTLRDHSEDEMAEALDRLMWGERQAGMETEKLLLLMVSAERDRRVAVESRNFVVRP